MMDEPAPASERSMAEYRAEVAADPRTCAELVVCIRSAPESDEAGLAMHVLTARADDESLAAALGLTRDATPALRECGAHVLGQFGWREHAGLEPSIARLRELLADPDDDVIASAIHALGHRHDARAAADVLAFRTHPNGDIREAVAFALPSLGAESNEAIVDALLVLMRDTAAPVRDWATFGLGTALYQLDTPRIREALVAQLADDDEETRREAVFGLCERRDPLGIETLVRLLDEDPTDSGLLLTAKELGGAEGRRILERALEKFSAEDARSAEYVRDWLAELEGEA
jgi:HEAT repeat protein